MPPLPGSPLLCEPLLKPTIWGGRRLQTVLGKRLPPAERIGECWETAGAQRHNNKGARLRAPDR